MCSKPISQMPNSKRSSRVRPIIEENSDGQIDENPSAQQAAVQDEKAGDADPFSNNPDTHPDTSDGQAKKSASHDDADDAQAQFTVELVGDQLGQAIGQIVKEAQYWAKRGRYNKVRILRGGKPVLPDIPVGALLAVEAATFFWSGLLRGVIANVAGKVLFEVVLINDAHEHLKTGREHFLHGDLDEAFKEMQAALAIDERDPEIHLALGSLQRARGRRDEAISSLKKTMDLDRNTGVGSENQSASANSQFGEHGEEARRQLIKMGLDL